MDPSDRHLTAERRFRELLEADGLEAPDRVEYDPEELVFFWEKQKLAVVVELGDMPTPEVSAGPGRTRAPGSPSRARA